MKILGFDVESTGLDPKKDSITEMGLVLYDTDAKAPVRISGFLVKGGLITAEIERITGITQAMLDTYGYPPEAYKKGKSASLRYLCADHNFTYDAHRAVNDVLATLKLLAMYDIDTVIQRSQITNVEVRAVVSYGDRLLAKELGFYWKAELKQWRRPMKQDEVQALKDSAPFPVILCEEK